jgi:multidrug efflux pump subunit AcrA (membrane-fusion protein)
MELHLVHKSGDGRLAVIGVLLRQGAANPSFDPIWQLFPDEPGTEHHRDGQPLDPGTLLPHARHGLQYSGSLTTPPCSEGVSWFVLDTPVELSAEQIARFAALYIDNARRVQPPGAGSVLGAASLYKKSQARPVIYLTEQPEIGDITKKIVATGSIVPRRKVEVKPKATGVLSELFVEAGRIVKQGDPIGKISIIPQGKSSTLIITATSSGMVIDVPVKAGNSVNQANNFNPGTTVAVIADMNDMIFDGRVDEADVAKIKEGMKLAIKVGAIENDKLEGTLEYISPKGKEQDGAIQFEVKAAVKNKDGIQLRANYSANADIVVDEKKQVLTIREALVQYQSTKPFIEVETAPQVFVRRDVKLGLSDGIRAEVLDGVTRTDKVKIPTMRARPTR